MEINKITQEIEIQGKTFVPITELARMAVTDVQGPGFDREEPFITKSLLYHNDNEFGFIGSWFDERIGFTVTLNDQHKDFQLSMGTASDLMINKLQLFDKLREWGFEI